MEKALLGHWICETYRAKYPEIYPVHFYFSKDKIVQLNADGKRTEWAYIVIESNNRLNYNGRVPWSTDKRDGPTHKICFPIR